MCNQPSSETSYLLLSCKKNFMSPFLFKSQLLPQSAISLPSPIISLLDQGRLPSTKETNSICGNNICIPPNFSVSYYASPGPGCGPRASGSSSMRWVPLRVSVWVEESPYLFLSKKKRLVAVEWAVVGAIGSSYEDRTGYGVVDCYYIFIAPKAGLCCCEGFYRVCISGKSLARLNQWTT